MGCLCSKKYQHRKHLEKENKILKSCQKKCYETLNLPSHQLYKLIYEESNVSGYLKGRVMFKWQSETIFIKKLGIYLPIRMNGCFSNCFMINLSNDYLSFKSEYISTTPRNNKNISVPKYSVSYKKNLIESNNQECPVCYDSKCNLKLPCDHTFCFDCIHNVYLSENKKCPICRSNIYENNIYHFEHDNIIYHPYQENYYILNDKKCLLCKDKYANRTTICGHHYCFDCILDYVLEINKCCPECHIPI